jgi:hypothetical protein
MVSQLVSAIVFRAPLRPQATDTMETISAARCLPDTRCDKVGLPGRGGGGECLTFEAVAGGRLGASWGRWGSVRGNGWCLLCLLVLLASLGAPICLYLAFDRTFVVLVVASILQSPPLG